MALPSSASSDETRGLRLPALRPRAPWPAGTVPSAWSLALPELELLLANKSVREVWSGIPR